MTALENKDWHLGILGHPLGHTLSPALHEFLLSACGQQGQYQVWDTPPDGLAHRLEMLYRMGVQGLNITIPHKVAVMAYLAKIDETAARIGAVNTLIRTDAGWAGTNTDHLGYWQGLPEAVRAALPQGHVLILGGGGAARAVLAALANAPPKQIRLLLRDMTKSPALLSLCQGLGLEASAASWDSDLVQQISEHTVLLVNTTPLGMAGTDGMTGTRGTLPISGRELAQLPQHCFVSDLVYRPAQTPLLTAASVLGLAHQNGLPMLVGQGVAAFELWLGVKLDSHTRHELLEHLRKIVSQELSGDSR